MSFEVSVIKIFDRWGCSARQAARILSESDDVGALVIAISIGLGDLFDDDKKAELAWLETVRKELDGWTPLGRILTDGGRGLREVMGLLDDARGLR